MKCLKLKKFSYSAMEVKEGSKIESLTSRLLSRVPKLVCKVTSKAWDDMLLGYNKALKETSDLPGHCSFTFIIFNFNSVIIKDS